MYYSGTYSGQNIDHAEYTLCFLYQQLYKNIEAEIWLSEQSSLFVRTIEKKEQSKLSPYLQVPIKMDVRTNYDVGTLTRRSHDTSE